MRLNRKWLYLGGLVTILTLLLTLTWVLPAGAVGTLDGGSVTVDKDYVSPEPDTTVADDNLDARTIEVASANPDLTSNQSVRDGGDFDGVMIAVTGAVDIVEVSELRINLTGAGSPNVPTDNVATGVAVLRPLTPITTDAADARVPGSAILPIVGDVTIDVGAGLTSSATARKLGTPMVINPAVGLINIPLVNSLADGDDIYLSYETSKSETALVNVRGDEDFDLVLVEGTAQGEYTGTFAVNTPDNVTMNNNVVIHEQHSIPSGLRGYIEVEDESISTFYFNETTPARAHDVNTGTLSGAQDFQNALGTLSDPAVPTSAVGIAVDALFYARVANPPIRTSVADGTELTNAAGQDIRHDAPAGVTVTLVNAAQGVLSFSSDVVFTGFSGGDIEVDYIGSDSFYVTVDHGPINLGASPGALNTNFELTDAGSAADPVVLPAIAVNGGDLTIALPTTDDDTASPDAGVLFDLVSLDNDGNTCDRCRLRIGVMTGPEDLDEPEALDSRYSVLAVSYSGSERIDIPNNLDASSHNVDTSGGNTPNVYQFTRVLAYAPLWDDANDDGELQDAEHNIAPMDSSHAGIATTVITVAAINGRRVTFNVDLTGLDRTTTANATKATDNDTFDITYSRQVGALPQNALNPDATTDRPVVALVNGARARITSSNDSTSVDAETQGPGFSNPMPVHRSGTGSNNDLLSIDVTDALAGVDEDSIVFKVRAGAATPHTVKNSDLTITEIEGGYRASIALDEVRTAGQGATLNVSTSRETPINWYVMADDNAGNSGTSDSNSEMRDVSGTDEAEDQNADNPAGYVDCQRRSAGSDDCYTFTVDGVSPTMQRAYTGDWFNVVEDRVEGDRLISRENYLPGKSSRTSVRVVFSEAVDGSTVSADDFTVDGVVPDDAGWYAEGETGGSDGADTVNGEIRRSVFLTVAEMDSDETPEVVLTGSVSDLAGNSVSSGTETAFDGLAPGATLEVDKSVSSKTVTVTVVSDEAVRLQSPDLRLWVSDALDNGIYSEALDEEDTFTVERETSAADSPLVIKDSAGNIVYSANLADPGTLEITLANAPILDRNTGSRTGTVDASDIVVSVTRDDPQNPTSVIRATNVDRISATTKASDAVKDAEKGRVDIGITGAIAALTNTAGAGEPDNSRPALPALMEGDEIVVTYRGTGPDPANQFSDVPTNARGVPTAGATNTWTYELDITRDDRYAVTAEMEDSNLNKGSGGVADPRDSDATVFEIDSELAMDTDTDASSTPGDGDSVGINDPLFIQLDWDLEEDEYVGDSHTNVTLTKAELNGEDVLANAVAQDANTYRIRIDGITLGDYTLVYNAMDDAGNTNARDRDLKFTVTEQPTWDLELKAGMNLVSLPSNPKIGDIDDVLGDASEIDLVFTFEGGQSMVAVRNPGTGGFVGTLTTIDARHAYWVSASNAVDVPINIPPTSQLGVLPSIPVKGGQWNLVPVLSLGRVDDSTAGSGAAPGTMIDADAYLGSFQTAFTWESGSWQRIDPDPAMNDGSHLGNDIDEPAEAGDDPLRVGQGYWVLYTEDAFIVPR